jgi:hypothetical protein
MIKRIWIEQTSGEGFDPQRDSADVLVETEDNSMWSASFSTITVPLPHALAVHKYHTGSGCV